MALVPINRRSLIGGVSQQPESSRLESQCEEQINAYSSTVDGLMKRPPTQHVAQIDAAQTLLTAPSKVHFINRSPTERYIVFFGGLGTGSDPIQVFDAITGLEMVVTDENSSSVSSSYLAVSSGDNLEMITLRDTTYVLNKEVTVQKDSTLLHDALDVSPTATPSYVSKSGRRAFIFIRSTNYLTRYAVRLVLTDRDGNDNPPNTTNAHLTRNTAWVKTFDGTSKKLNFSGRAATFPMDAGDDQSPAYSPPTGEYAGQQMGSIDPAEVILSLWDRASEGFDVSSPVTVARPKGPYNGGIRSVFNRQGRGGTGATIPMETAPTGNGNQETTLQNLLTLGSTLDIDGNSDVPPTGAGVMMFEGLQSRKNDDGDYVANVEIEAVTDGASQAGDMIVFKDEIQNLTDLPLICWPGHVIKVLQADGANEGFYYVEFEADSIEAQTPTEPDLVQGRWKESRASLDEYALDATTMPHRLVRVADGAEPSGFRWEFREVEWNDREVGDSVINPDPSFVGSTIQSMFFWNSRLGFVTGAGTLAMSEVGEFGSFYRTTMLSVPDSDPVDIEVGAREGGAPRYAVPQSDLLLVFCDEQQFVVTSEGVFGPSTARVNQVAEYDTYFDVPPVSTETGTFFAYPGAASKFSQIRQLRRQGDSFVFEAFDATAQVPRYIAGRVDQMAANTVENVLAVRTDDTDTMGTIWIYKWFDAGSQGRVLSAWMKFVLGPQDAPTTNANTTALTEVIGMGWFDNDLYVVLARVSDDDSVADHFEFVIERIRFADQYGDSFPESTNDPTNRGSISSQYVTLLDRRLTDSDVDIGYDYNAQELRVLLPYGPGVDPDNASGRPTYQLVTRVNSNDSGSAGSPTSEGVVWPVESVTLSLSGGVKTELRVKDPGRVLHQALNSPIWGSTQNRDDRATRFYVGVKYEMDYQFSRLALRDTDQSNRVGEVLTGRFQLKFGTVLFKDTGYLKVLVTPELRSGAADVAANYLVNRDPQTFETPFLTLGVAGSFLESANLRDGTLRFPILTTPELVRIFLKNDSPFPSNVQALLVEGEFNQKVGR